MLKAAAEQFRESYPELYATFDGSNLFESKYNIFKKNKFAFDIFIKSINSLSNYFLIKKILYLDSNALLMKWSQIKIKLKIPLKLFSGQIFLHLEIRAL